MKARAWYFLLGGLWAASLWGCATVPTTAVVDGVVMPRETREYGGQPFLVRHTGAHPRPKGPSSGLRDTGGKISGQVCGIDINFEVEHQGDHVQLVGFLDNDMTSQLQVRDQGGERLISGNLGNAGVDLRLRSNELVGVVGIRAYSLAQEGDQLKGTVKMSGTDEPAEATVNGRDALWAMPAADQAAVLPGLLACFIAKIGNYGRSPLTVGFGGKPGAVPHGTAELSSPNGTQLMR